MPHGMGMLLAIVIHDEEKMKEKLVSDAKFVFLSNRIDIREWSRQPFGLWHIVYARMARRYGRCSCSSS